MSINSASSMRDVGAIGIEDYVSGDRRLEKGVRTAQAPAGLDSIAQNVNAPNTTDSTSGFGGVNDGVTNERGAPALYLPSQSFSISDLMIQMQKLSIESQQEQAEFTKSNLESNVGKQEKINQKTLDNLQEAQEKEREAAKGSVWGKIFGWLGKVVAVVAAAVAVAVSGVAAVASGGAAVPLLALSTIALVGATMSLADQVSQELGGPEISLSNFISSTSVKLLEAFGVEKDEAEKIGKVLVGAAAIALPILAVIEPKMLGTAAEGIALLAGASPETASKIGLAVGVVAMVTVGIMVFVATTVASGGLSVLPNAAKLANSIIQSASAVVRGGTMIGTGAAGIYTAVKTKDVALLQAQKMDLQTTLKALRTVMKEQQETLSALLQQIQDGMKGVATLISELSKSLSQISSNLGRTQSA